MVENRMAGELFQLLSPYNHINIIAHLSNKDIFAQKHFVHHWLNKSYWMDTRKCYNQRRKNSQQIFKIFGAFNEESQSQVHENVVQLIQQEKDIYSSVDQHHLCCCKLSIDEWIMLMSSDSVFGDKLMLYALSRIYQRHVVIFTAHGYWTMVGSDEPLSPLRLLDICEVKLMFIGMHMYLELKLKPFVPVHLPAITELPCGNIPRPTEPETIMEKAVDLTTSTSVQPPVIVTDDDVTEGSESDTPNESDTLMDNCSLLSSMNDSSTQASSDSSDLSNTPSESLLTPRKVSSDLDILGINDDINKLVKNWRISSNMTTAITMDSCQSKILNNAPMGINDTITDNSHARSSEDAVINKNVIAINAKPDSIGITSSAMGVNPYDVMSKTNDINDTAKMGINVTAENVDPCKNSAVMGKNVINTNAKTVSTEIASGVLGVNPNFILPAMGKNIDNNGNTEMGTNVIMGNVDLCENGAAMGINVLNTNAQITSGVMGVNPDSILTVKDMLVKNVDNAEMGINIMEKNKNARENSTVMGKNVINIENNVITDATNTTLDTEKSVCQQNNVMCSDAGTSPMDPYLDARLSGALEQLNPSEMTALNTLVCMGIQPPLTTGSSSYETDPTPLPYRVTHAPFPSSFQTG